MGISLNPLTYLFSALLPALTQVHWFTYVNVVSGAFFCSVFLRKIGVSPLGTITGGFAYVTGNWWIVPLTYFVPVLPMLPLVGLVLLDVRNHVIRSGILGTLLCGYIWLGVTFQVSLMVFTFLGVGLLAMLWNERRRGRNWLLQRLTCAAGMLLIGVVLGLPKILPSWTYGLLSWREHGLSSNLSTIEGLTILSPVRYLFPYTDFPFLNFGNGLVGIFIGTVAFVFLLMGIVNRQRSARLWIVAYLFVLALAIDHSVVAAVVHSVPPFSFFRGAGRWMIIGNFLAAVLCAFGFDRLAGGESANLRHWIARGLRWLSIALVVGLVLMQLGAVVLRTQIIALFQAYFAHFHQTLHLTQPLGYYLAFVSRRIDEFIHWPLFLHPRFLFPFASLLLITVLLDPRIWRNLRHRGQRHGGIRADGRCHADGLCAAVEAIGSRLVAADSRLSCCTPLPVPPWVSSPNKPPPNCSCRLILRSKITSAGTAPSWHRTRIFSGTSRLPITSIT